MTYTLLNIRGELAYVEGHVDSWDLNRRVAVVIEDNLDDVPEDEPVFCKERLSLDVWKFVPDPDDREWDD
jgi:hypothetical protein